MGMWEWLKKSHNPTFEGYVEWDGKFTPNRPRGLVLIRFLVSVCIVGTLYCFVLRYVLKPTVASVAIAAGGNSAPRRRPGCAARTCDGLTERMPPQPLSSSLSAVLGVRALITSIRSLSMAS